MKRLYLIRHAKSSWSVLEKHDFDRPLSNRGKRDSVLIGERFAASNIRPDLVISSPARRARKTARAIAAQIGYKKRDIVLADELYTFDFEGLPDVLHTIDDAVDIVIMVGHNEAISDFAHWLIGKSFGSVPTCAVVAMSLARDRWTDVTEGDGELLFYDYPKRSVGREKRP